MVGPKPTKRPSENYQTVSVFLSTSPVAKTYEPEENVDILADDDSSPPKVSTGGLDMGLTETVNAGGDHSLRRDRKSNMGRILYFRRHYVHRLPKSITELVASPDISLELSQSHVPVICHCPCIGSSIVSRTSTNQLSTKVPICVHKQSSIGNAVIRSTPHRLMFCVGFHESCHSSEKTQFFVEPAANFCTVLMNKKISEDADKICRILSSQPVPSISESLDEAEIRVSPDLAAEVLKRLSNSGILALSFFRWAEKQHGFKYTTQVFHHLIDALGKIKQFRLIWSLVESMKQNGILKKETFNLISRRYARARKIREAVEAFEKMEMFGLKPESSDYNGLIDTISKSRNVTRAQEVLDHFRRRKKFSPDLKTYTILLEGLGQEKNFTRLKAVYDEMIREGFEPDIVTYGIQISAFCKSGKCEDALRIFHSMEESGCRPSPHIYCTLINRLGSEKRLDEALKFFELSKAAGHPPEAPTYNAVVGSYCWALRFEDAFLVVEEMKTLGIGPNPRTFDIILHHLIKSGSTEVAYNLFQNMSRYGDCEPQLNTYSMIVSMLCSEDRVDYAIKIWKEMNEKGIFPCMHMFSSLITGLCYDNRLEEACKYFEDMLDRGIRPPEREREQNFNGARPQNSIGK
ncbi:Pentatricopeptide repeat-containing protein [Apostasia shenzhenica]|uniref:Pentatricopeptide repeat-containing protein n=1 Tax=Apostasia shenzhenica TaxID=1088818 RepID=A0A2I0BA34_9ASPA|nr:Pentatricopeptide repeat-containing protein [Apostasia shenzhenica]